MAPPKKGDLIKGQASLANFFSGGGLTPAQVKEKKKASEEQEESQKSKSKSPSKPKSERSNSISQQEVTEIKEKITVAGYKASPSASPNKKETSSKAKASEMAPAATSKYFASSKASGGGKGDAIAVSDSSDEDVKPIQKRKASATKAKLEKLSDSDSDLDFQKPAKKSKTAASGPSTSASAAAKKVSPRKETKATKAKHEDDYDDEFDDLDFNEDDLELLDEFKPDSKAKSNGKKAEDSKSTAKPSSAGKANAKEPAKVTKTKTEDAMDIDVDEKPAAEKPKFNWAAAAQRKAMGPAAPGSKEIPAGKPNCLAGLTLVFTGELSSLSREDATDLAKRFGAKVTGSLSSKTSYVVIGAEAGKSKIEKQKQTKTPILDEDGFLNLIAEKSAGPVKIDEATQKKMDEEKRKIAKAAAEMKAPAHLAAQQENALWTVRYAPQTVKDLVGNGASIAKLQAWLRDWQKSYAAGFKKPGKDAMNIFRAVLISGPPGIGKTSAAHIVAKAEGYTPIEFNASDVRSKKLIEASLNDTINNSSLDSWYNGKGSAKSSTGVVLTDRTVLIMDEVDGMSGGDRGGVGAINALIKKTKVPIICICNDNKNPKMKPMERTAAQLKFSKPDARQARTRLMTIAFREKLKIEPEVMDQLVQAAQSDIRLVINMLSTWALDKKRSMDFDEGKQLGSANVKPGLHTPFSLYSALSAPGLWAQTSRKTLNDKTDYYFQDHSFVPLMVQQNYINLTPSSVNQYSGKEREVKLMQTITRAAESISDGEMVDRLIHSAEQHWSLMPFHGIMSCVKPMALAHGSSATFPQFST
jgi:replication factor C subunit 1